MFLIAGNVFGNTVKPSEKIISVEENNLTIFAESTLNRTISDLDIWYNYPNYNYTIEFLSCSWNISVYNGNGELVAASVGSAEVSSTGACDNLVRAIEDALINGIQ